MKHRSHVIPFVLVALAAMIVLFPRNGTGFGVGLGLVLLLCPLLMGTMMWLMMRRPDAVREHPEHVQSPESANRRDRSRFGGTTNTQLAVLLFVGLGVAVMIRGASAADSNRAFNLPTAVTVSLASLPPEMSAMYQYAADHADHFATIPCYCGCDDSLGHSNLKDCFVTPEGRWDAHASGCGVCSAEATTAKELFDAGTRATEVRQQIVDRYGPPPATQQGTQP